MHAPPLLGDNEQARHGPLPKNAEPVDGLSTQLTRQGDRFSASSEAQPYLDLKKSPLVRKL